jgi:hypothetical protein
MNMHRNRNTDLEMEDGMIGSSHTTALDGNPLGWSTAMEIERNAMGWASFLPVKAFLARGARGCVPSLADRN